jgi:putative methyltransferase (TIGR04325 family)
MPNLSQLVEQMLPPFIYNTVDRLIKTRKHPVFNSYQNALAYCSKKGYENDLLIDVLTYKMKYFLERQKVEEDKTLTTTQSFTLLSITKLLASYPDKKLFHILDFGGNLGGHYHDLKKVFGDSIKLKWAVVETPALAKAGQHFANEELSFFDSIESAAQFLGKIDLVHSSGTLQCVEEPKQYLDRLLQLDSEFMLFNRLGLNRKNRDFITIHHSKLSWNGHPGLPPGVDDQAISYPFTFLSEEYFYDTLASNYQIVARFNDNSGILDIPSEEIVGGGLLFSRR